MWVSKKEWEDMKNEVDQLLTAVAIIQRETNPLETYDPTTGLVDGFVPLRLVAKMMIEWWGLQLVNTYREDKKDKNPYELEPLPMTFDF